MLEKHDFYCLNCGRKGIPLPRKGNKEIFHRKKLYCPWCNMTINHIECRTPQESEQFLEDYAEGLYDEEREEALQYIQEEKENGAKKCLCNF